MYSSGSVEGGTSSLSGKSNFVDKMQHACSQVPSDAVLYPILSSPSSVKLRMGNWSLACENDGEIVIRNEESPQVRILGEGGRKGGRKGEREGGREGRREREGGRKREGVWGGREKGGRKGEREGGREGRREREGGRKREGVWGGREKGEGGSRDLGRKGK